MSTDFPCLDEPHGQPAPSVAFADCAAGQPLVRGSNPLAPTQSPDRLHIGLVAPNWNEPDLVIGEIVRVLEAVQDA